VRVLITGPRGFERTAAFARDEALKRIARSAERRRMAGAQRKRWAVVRKAKGAAATPAPAKAAGKKRRLSPEGRARIVAATKRRRAALRKAKTDRDRAAETIWKPKAGRNVERTRRASRSAACLL
jgi:hypothetical protein